MQLNIFGQTRVRRSQAPLRDTARAVRAAACNLITIASRGD
jgi:hypothetical protein